MTTVKEGIPTTAEVNSTFYPLRALSSVSFRGQYGVCAYSDGTRRTTASSSCRNLCIATARATEGGGMEKRMEAVIVRTNDRGQIEIVQEDHLQNEDHVIAVFPEQVDTMIAWVQEAKAELTRRQGAG